MILEKNRRFSFLSMPFAATIIGILFFSATEDLSIDQDGVIVIPCLTTCDAISSFLRLNHRQILEARKTHARYYHIPLHRSCNTSRN